MTFGERIRAAREAKGWSVYVLADVTNLGISALTRIESGEAHPGKLHWGTVQLLARALGIPLDDLCDPGLTVGKPQLKRRGRPLADKGTETL